MYDGDHYECQRVKFKATPEIYLNLSAVAIGVFQFIKGEMNSVAQRINPKRATFALDMTIKVLTF